MRKLILLFVLPLIGLAQSGVDAGLFKKTGGTTMNLINYRLPLNDTTQWLNNLQYKKLWVNVLTTDTARFIMYYQVGNDTTNFGGLTNFDSVVVTSKTAESWDATNYIGGFPFIRFVVKNDTVTATDSVRIYTNDGDSIAAETYNNAYADTSQWLNQSAYETLTLYLVTLDSARITVAYQVANDTTSFSAKTVFDSLVTTSNSGATDSWDVTPYYQHNTYIRFIFAAASGNYGQGTTSNTLSAYFRRIAFGHNIGTYSFGYKREK